MSLAMPCRISMRALLVLSLSTAPALAGPVPNILIWHPDHTSPDSGPALLADLEVLGEDAVLVDELFAFSPDLSDHEIVMGVLGVTPDTHMLDDTEGGALDAYVQNGGLLYLEGADCFNYDPQFGAYDVRPIFGLADGSDGSSIFNDEVVGIGPLAELELHFQYFGEPSFLDVLAPVTSTAILRKEANDDVLAVFHPSYGSGRSIGISCEYGGLFDFSNVSPRGLTMRQELLAACLDLLRSGGTVATPGVAAPPSLVLRPAVPNPLRSGTTIRYELSHATRVRLSIYDVTGRLVRTLTNRTEGLGSHAVRWDGRDDGGERVASGVYFYALDTGEQAPKRRVQVLR